MTITDTTLTDLAASITDAAETTSDESIIQSEIDATPPPSNDPLAELPGLDPLILAVLKEYVANNPDDPAHGYIPVEKEYEFASSLWAAIFCTVCHKAADIQTLPINIQAQKKFTDTLISLHGRIFKGMKQVRDADGNVIGQTRDTRNVQCSGSFQELTKRKGLAIFASLYRPTVPALEHSPDPVKALENCSKLFPNVKDPVTTVNAMQALIEAIHHLCHTIGAEEVKRAFVFYSPVTGGTGKSWFLSAFTEALQRLGIDAATIPSFDATYPPAQIALQTVSVLMDVGKLKDMDETYLNNLIDHELVDFNAKYGAKGFVRSWTTLVMATNYAIFESNDRRYLIVTYQPTNVEDALSDEDRATYFPFWGNKEGAIEAITELIKVMPFRSEHSKWERPKVVNELGVDVSRIVVKDKWSQPLSIAQRCINVLNHYSTSEETLTEHESSVAHSAIVDTDGKPKTKYAYYKSRLDNMRPSEFANIACDVLQLDGYERQVFKGTFPKFIKQLHSDDHLAYKGQNDPYYARQSMWVLSSDNMTCDEAYADSEDDTPLESTRKKWTALVEAEKNNQ